MEIDLFRLHDLLSQTWETTPRSTNISPYLYQIFQFDQMTHNPVCITDLDCDAFTLMDLDELEEWLDHLYNHCHQVNALAKPLSVLPAFTQYHSGYC